MQVNQTIAVTVTKKSSADSCWFLSYLFLLPLLQYVFVLGTYTFWKAENIKRFFIACFDMNFFLLFSLFRNIFFSPSTVSTQILFPINRKKRMCQSWMNRSSTLSAYVSIFCHPNRIHGSSAQKWIKVHRMIDDECRFSKKKCMKTTKYNY